MKNQKAKTSLGSVLRRLFVGMPVFWHHMIPMGVILALAALIQLISSSAYTGIIADSYLQQTRENFVRSCDRFSNAIYDIYTVPPMLEATASYDSMTMSVSGELPRTAISLSLRGMQSSFNDTFALIGMPEDVECFLYYPDADALFTRQRVFSQAEKCFEEYIRYDGITPQQVLEQLDHLGASMSLQGAVLDGDTPCVTVLMNPSRSHSVLGLLYPYETLQQQFGMQSLPEDSFLQLVDPDGNVIYACGERDANCYTMSVQIRGIRCSAVLGIPWRYFRQLAAPTRNFSIGMLALTLLVGLVLAIGFSNAGTRPLRRLLSSYAVEDQPSDSRNEIYRLAELLATSRQTKETVSQVLSINVLTRVLSGGVLTQHEEEALMEAYPILAESCRIAIVHTTDPAEEFGQTAITELLQEHLPENFACSTVNRLETGVLFPDDTDALHALAEVLSGVNLQLQMDGITVQCGVSASFIGAHSAYAAVRQARFSIPIRESSFIEVYSAQENDGDDRPGVFSWLTHERLYQAVMKNDRSDTVDFIRALAEDRYYSAADAKEVFYNVRFVVRSTAGEMHLPLPEADTLEYREELRPKDNFRLLEELACTLFDRLHARRETTDANALDSVIAYIEENFRNPELSAQTVATHFSLPVKTVYAALREVTELNFNDYVTSLRMKEAARLLCTTGGSVDEIGAQCGYPAQSTFYRVFKKYFGESPNRYRSLHPREE